MANSKSNIFLMFILICSLANVGHSQGDSLPCVQKLLPCQPYLKGSPSPPPASCCVALKQIIAGDSQCLCGVFNNPDLLKSLNVTQDDALNLAKSCGANADTSICKKAATPSTSPSTPAAPSANSSTTSPPPEQTKSSATTISHVGGSLGLVAVLSFIVSSF